MVNENHPKYTRIGKLLNLVNIQFMCCRRIYIQLAKKIKQKDTTVDLTTHIIYFFGLLSDVENVT